LLGLQAVWSAEIVLNIMLGNSDLVLCKLYMFDVVASVTNCKIRY
jgi:hypothetical protein